MNDSQKIRDTEKLERAKLRLRKSYEKVYKQKYDRSIIYVIDTPRIKMSRKK